MKKIHFICFLVIIISIGIAPMSLAEDYDYNLDVGDILIVEVTKFDEDNGLFTAPRSYIIEQYGIYGRIIKNDAKEGERAKLQITNKVDDGDDIELEADKWGFTDGDFVSNPDFQNINMAAHPADPRDFIYEYSTFEIMPFPVKDYIGGIQHPSVWTGMSHEFIEIETSESTLRVEYDMDKGIAEKIQIKNSSGQLIYEVTLEISIFGGGIPGYDILFVLACLSLTSGLLLDKKRKLSPK